MAHPALIQQMSQLSLPDARRQAAKWKQEAIVATQNLTRGMELAVELTSGGVAGAAAGAYDGYAEAKRDAMIADAQAQPGNNALSLEQLEALAFAQKGKPGFVGPVPIILIPIVAGLGSAFFIRNPDVRGVVKSATFGAISYAVGSAARTAMMRMSKKKFDPQIGSGELI